MPFDRDTLLEHFGTIWPVHVERFTELLITLRVHFRGDLELMLVLAIIGTRTLPGRRIDGLSYDAFLEGGRHATPPAPINVHSIAECTGIPRETVRRKVQRLDEMGWTERDAAGHLVVSAKAAMDLASATEATFRYLVAIGAACSAAAEPA